MKWLKVSIMCAIMGMLSASSSSASHGCTAEFNRLAFIEGALPSVLHATTLQSNGLSSLSMCGRRRFLAGITLAGELGVGEARAEGGQPKPTDEDSISFNAFVADVDKQLIQAVDFYGPNGDKAYATYKSDGHRIRIGEGFPIEIGNEASSPLQVVRLLQKKEVSYKFHLLDKVSYKKMGAY